MVRTVPTGQGSEIREVYENKTCRGCQGLLVAPHVQLGYKACHCTDGERGHRTLRCLDCKTVHYEPEHSARADRHLEDGRGVAEHVRGVGHDDLASGRDLIDDPASRASTR